MTPPRAARLALLLAFVLVAGEASAHRLAPALLELVERDGGLVDVRWKTSLQVPSGSDVRPVLPPHCAAQGTPALERDGASATARFQVACGEEGLVGHDVSVSGLATSGTNALVRVVLADGRRARAVLHAQASTFTVPARQSRSAVVWDYGRLGVEHILTGVDHLLFVLGLVLLVAGRRRLVWTITSFTLGHSVTLSLAALGFVRFPSALVELVIAGTILAVAVELARPAGGGPGRLARAPWLVGFGFGLLHGLGFAGALTEIGLPGEEIPLALASFNVGIELGQLAFVVSVLLLGRALRQPFASAPPWLARVPAYGIGSLAAYWCFDRAAGLF